MTIWTDESLLFIIFFLLNVNKGSASLKKRNVSWVVPGEDLPLLSPVSPVVLFCAWCAFGERSLPRSVAFASCDKIDGNDSWHHLEQPGALEDCAWRERN